MCFLNTSCTGKPFKVNVSSICPWSPCVVLAFYCPKQLGSFHCFSSKCGGKSAIELLWFLEGGSLDLLWVAGCADGWPGCGVHLMKSWLDSLAGMQTGELHLAWV